MWCKQCKREKPPDQFLPVKKGWQVTICDPCARENVRRWSRKVETDPDKVRRAGRDD